MRFCTNCGTALAENAVFCDKCGAKQPNAAPVAPARPAAAPAPAYPVRAAAPAAPVAPVRAAAPAAPVRPAGTYTAPVYRAPVVQLKTNRSLLKMILLSIITLGIYGLVVMSGVSTDINTIAARYDGKKTMHFCLLFFLVGELTLGIGYLVWYHKISKRIGDELYRRGINYSFGAGSFWGWGVLGALIVVGPLVYTHKLLKSMNLLSADFNVNG